AVFAARDATLERLVPQWVILRVHGEPPVARFGRQVLGHGPRDQDAVVLQAEVVVEAAGVVLLDHEHRPRGLIALGLVPERLRRPAAVPLASVFVEVGHHSVGVGVGAIGVAAVGVVVIGRRRARLRPARLLAPRRAPRRTGLLCRTGFLRGAAGRGAAGL